MPRPREVGPRAEAHPADGALALEGDQAGRRLARRLRAEAITQLLNPLGKVAAALVGYADRLAAAAAGGRPATPV